MTGRVLAPRNMVAYPGLCCPGWCYLPREQPDEVHGLTRDPRLYGLPLVRVARNMIGRRYEDRWFWTCHVPSCQVDSSGDVDGADAQPAALREALDHLHEYHADRMARGER